MSRTQNAFSSNAVVPFCQIEAPGAFFSKNSEFEHCLICCQDKPKFAAVGKCGHTEVCWLCAVRLRALLKDTTCPMCKEDLPQVAIVSNSRDASFPSKAVGRDEKLGLVYHDASVMEEVERLFDYTCWQKGCSEAGRCFGTLEELERHLLQHHNRCFCPTCLRERKVFLFEQLLYYPSDLERHHNEGDRKNVIGPSLPPSNPHAFCEFCKKHVYSEEQLLNHMYRKHHLCGVCERMGHRGEFYSDYGHLSLHYEEHHHVCNHESCQRGPYRLAAFDTSDALWLHEVKEHSSKASQKARKQGNRIQIQLGAASYREEQDRRRIDSGPSRPSFAAAVTAAPLPSSPWTGAVQFRWPRGRVSAKVDDEWVDILGRGQRQTEEDDENKYPPRPVAKGKAKRPPMAVSCVSTINGVQFGGSSSSTKAKAKAKSTPIGPVPRPSQEVEDVKPDPAIEEMKSRSRFLALAVQRIDQTGIDVISQLEQEEYRERNRRFKRDLEATLGADLLRSFKECSAQFRRSLADVSRKEGDTAVKTYAQKVLEVFSASREALGDFVAAELLSDLVLLLPDAEPRRRLRQELLDISKREADSAKVAEKQHAKRNNAQKVSKQEPAEVTSPTASSPPLAMPRALEDLAVSCTRVGSERQLSFLATLSAVLNSGVADQASPSLKRQVLQQLVKQLSSSQVDTLQSIQQHLHAAGATDLDFGSLERVMALRPLLSLKLQAQQQQGEGAGVAADRARCWKEWKAAAFAAISRLGKEEQRSLRLYVSLCLSHSESLRSGQGAPVPQTSPAPDLKKQIPSVWERSEVRRPGEAEFPALPGSERPPPTRQQNICLGAPTSTGPRGAYPNARRR